MGADESTDADAAKGDRGRRANQGQRGNPPPRQLSFPPERSGVEESLFVDAFVG